MIEFVRQLLNEHVYTPDELAHVCGKSKQTIKLWAKHANVKAIKLADGTEIYTKSQIIKMLKLEDSVNVYY